MSIWSSWRDVKALTYGHAGVYPWEGKPVASAAVSLSTVSDYVYDPAAIGETVLPFLRLCVDGFSGTEHEHATVVLTEKQARRLRRDLGRWLAMPKCPIEKEPTDVRP
jgi:hypothetical protein